MREQWPFFRTRIDMLEMVLAKADADIARLYDERLVQPDLLPLGAHLRDLLSQACSVVLGLTGQSQLLAHSRTHLSSSVCATPTSTRCTCCRPSCWRARVSRRPHRTALWNRRCWCLWPVLPPVCATPVKVFCVFSTACR